MTTYNVRSALDEREMHAFKFNIKPENISKTEPGLLTMQSVAEGGQAVAEFPSTGDDFYFYTGHTSQAKDVDCALVWDESSQTYVLHALSSFTKFTKVNKKPPKPVVRSQVAAPAVPSPATAPKPLPFKTGALAEHPMQKTASTQPQASVSASSSPVRPPLPTYNSAPVVPQQAAARPPPPPVQSTHQRPPLQPQSDDDEDEESGSEESGESEGSDSDESEDFGDLASQMELGVSK